MNCPDIDRLIDLQAGLRTDPDLEDHLVSCESCQAELQVIQELREAVNPGIEVPQGWIQEGMAEIRRASHLSTPTVSVPQLITAGILGSLTGLVTSVLAGTAGAARPVDVLLFSIGVGVASIGFQVREGRTPPPSAS